MWILNFYFPVSALTFQKELFTALTRLEARSAGQNVG